MMTDMTMDNFLTVLSSSEPVPGGGGACGYVAAVGMSLGNMVLALTTGKKKYAEYQEEIEELHKQDTRGSGNDERECTEDEDQDRIPGEEL